jgi:hypothetical protein
MKRGIMKFSSFLGVTLFVSVIVSLPFLIIKSDEGQFTYTYIMMWVAIGFHIMRFTDWLWKDKEDKK